MKPYYNKNIFFFWYEFLGLSHFQNFLQPWGLCLNTTKELIHHNLNKCFHQPFPTIHTAIQDPTIKKICTQVQTKANSKMLESPICKIVNLKQSPLKEVNLD